MTRNEAGGFIFQNVGELNPRIAFESNNIQYCGVGVLNNTAVGVVDFFVQNTKLLTIANNYLGHNAGGININTTTKDNEVALYANITNNVIVYTTHGDALHIEGLYILLSHYTVLQKVIIVTDHSFPWNAEF